MASFFLGFLIVVIGGAIIYRSADLVNIFGRNEWADRNFGGTRQAYVIAGFLVMIIGLLVLFGIIDITKDPAGFDRAQLQEIDKSSM